MATAPIGATPSTLAAAATQQLGLQQLMKTLLTQLTHQDPFKPVENTDFMGQVAQFASLESSQQLNRNIEQLLLVQAIGQSVGLIGRQVSAATDSGTIAGRVTSLSLKDGVPRLTITTNGDRRVFPNIAIGQLLTVQPS